MADNEEGASKSVEKKDSRFIIALDMGGTKILALAMDAGFNKLGKSRKKTLPKKPPVGAEAVFDRMCEVIDGAIEDGQLDKGDLAGIGVGSPGPLDPDAGVLIDLANLPFKNFPLVDRLRKAYKVPVLLDNDVNVGTFGEYHFGSAKGGRHVLGVFPGTGIGGALVLDGRIHHGASGAAGEFGHMIYDPHGPLCGCGREGCIEAFSGRTAIAARLAMLVVRNEAPALAKEAGANLADIRSGPISRAVEDGDKKVEAVVREEAFRIGVMTASAVNLLSPDRIVLGGGLVEAMPKLFTEEIDAALDRYALPFLRKFVKVVEAELGDDAVIMGAARMISEKVDLGSKGAE
jgi:glucokinase